MILQIALCDDDAASLDLLECLIQNFARERKMEADVDRYASGEDLLAAGHMQKAYDIIFMDIYLTSDGDRPDGIDIIRKLDISRKQQVVFTTTSRAYAIEAFGLNAAHYLVKPLTQAQVTEAMERCLERLGRGLADTLEVRTKQGTVFIPMENIIYIEVFNKRSIIRTAKNAIQTYASLDSLYELLDENLFIRAQRSFIVNMSYIEEFSFDHVILPEGKKIMLSRGNRKDLKNRYQRFLFDLARRGDI